MTFDSPVYAPASADATRAERRGRSPGGPMMRSAPPPNRLRPSGWPPTSAGCSKALPKHRRHRRNAAKEPMATT